MNLKENWQRLRHTARYRNFLLYLLFVGVAAVFWVIIAMNDSAQVTANVRVAIIDKPDSVTFINLPPTEFHVTVRDKGTSLMRSAIWRNPRLVLNFKEFAHNGVWRVTSADLFAAMRNMFGSNAQISAVSIDSIHLSYTDLPGRRVPIEINAKLTAASGYVIDPKLIPSSKYVTIYSADAYILDSVMSVKTKQLAKSNLSQNSTFTVDFAPIKGVRIDPGEISINVNVQPLVSKQFTVEIKVVNVPKGENILLFPSVVTVDGYVPMDQFNNDMDGLKAVADYRDIKAGTRKIPVSLEQKPDMLVNPTVTPSSVEYTLVR